MAVFFFSFMVEEGLLLLSNPLYIAIIQSCFAAARDNALARGELFYRSTFGYFALYQRIPIN